MSDFWGEDAKPVADAKPSDNSDFWGEEARHPELMHSAVPPTNLMMSMFKTSQHPLDTAEDAGLGAAQGATANFADELYGAGKTIPSVVGDLAKNFVSSAQGKGDTKVDFEKWAKQYRLNQQDADKVFEDAKHRSPFAYGSGQLAGNVVPALATGTVGGMAGLSSSGARAGITAALTDGGEVTGSNILNALGKTGVAAAKDAAEMGPLTAAQEVGDSDATTDTAEGRARLQDAALHGLKTGGMVGGALSALHNLSPSVTSALSSAAGAGSDSVGNALGLDAPGPYTRKFMNAYKYGKDGVNLGDEEVKGQFMTRPWDHAEGVTDQINQGKQMFGQKISTAISAAEANGGKVPIGDAVSGAADKISAFLDANKNIDFDAKSKDIIGRILGQNDVISPSEAQYLKQQLAIVSEKANSPNAAVLFPITDALGTMQKGLDTAMGNFIPGYKDAAKDYANFMNKVPEQLVAGNKSPETAGVFMGNMKNPDGKLTQSITDLIKGATKEGSGSGDQAGAMVRLKQSLLDLQKSNPEAFYAMGTTPDGIVSGLKDQADDSSLIHEIHGVSPNAGFDAKEAALGIWGAGKGKVLQGANKLGLYQGKVANAAESAYNYPRKITYDMPMEHAAAMGDRLMSSDSDVAKNIGENLKKAATDNDMGTKTRMLFVINQNPTLKKMLGIDGGDQK